VAASAEISKKAGLSMGPLRQFRKEEIAAGRLRGPPRRPKKKGGQMRTGEDWPARH